MEITIGKSIKDLRKRDNRTQEDFATALGVTCQVILLRCDKEALEV